MREIYQICRVFLLISLLYPFAGLANVNAYPFHDQTTKERAIALAKTLRCLQCQNQNLFESNSNIAYNLRLELYQLADEGKTNQQIIEIMTDRFGNFVRYDPPFLPSPYLLWGLSLFLLLITAILIKIYLYQRDKSNLSHDKQR